MIEQTRVRDFMATNLITLHPEIEILRAVHTLLDNNISSAPVLDDNDLLVGILTERDCIEVALNAGYHSGYGGRVAEFMSTNVQTLAADDSIVDAAKQFFGQRFHRYPVLDNGRLVGQLSRRDILRALASLW